MGMATGLKNFSRKVSHSGRKPEAPQTGERSPTSTTQGDREADKRKDRKNGQEGRKLVRGVLFSD